MTVEWPAVRAGALAAIAICLPVAIVANVLIDDDESGAVTASILAVLAGFAVGGWVAAKRSTDMPYSSAGISGLAAFAAIELVTIASRSIRGEEIEYVLIVANAFFAYGAAMLGAAIVARRAPQ